MRVRRVVGLTRALLAVVVLCGCNQLYGLQSTELLDAPRPGDARTHAAPMCPPIGTAPTFSRSFQLAVAQYCTEYSVSTPSQIATARCWGPFDGIGTGRADDDMTLIAGVPSDSNTAYENPRIAPEGDRLFLRKIAYNSIKAAWEYGIAEFGRNVDGSWSYLHETIFPSWDGRQQLGSVSRGRPRYVMVSEGLFEIRQYRYDEPTWTPMEAYAAADFGMDTISWPNLHADPRRLIFFGTLTTSSPRLAYYADRDDVGMPFHKPVEIAVLPAGLGDAFLAEDCSKIYFPGLNSVFYAPAN